MKFVNLSAIKDEEFLRLTGIKRNTFNKIVAILKEAELKKFYRGGRKNKLSIEDHLLMTLEYWREYPTYFHIGQSFGISETNCIRNTQWIENTLIKHPDFQQLSSQKSLLKKHFKDKTFIIDVTETPIQRPKKVKRNIIQEKRKNTQ